jgi:hypothetical protein
LPSLYYWHGTWVRRKITGKSSRTTQSSTMVSTTRPSPLASSWELNGYFPRLHVNYRARRKEIANSSKGLSPFAWVFFTWAPAVLIPAPVNVIFGIGDAVLAAHLSYTTHLLAGYSPKRDRHCSPTSTHEFQLPPGAQESFFEAIARLYDPQEEATAMCNSFLKEWYYSVAVSLVTHALIRCFAN